ncbi:MAG: hypothetical protein ACRC14_13595 [Paracoccaceae bacterium]
MRWTVLLLLVGCGAVDYENAPVGRFAGSVIVMWVDETQDRTGDGTFVFVPSQNPLTFTRVLPDGSDGQTIQPGMMYTDGGSVPQIAQAFNGFSPWGYAPAYMVHDWLFAARHCIRDEKADENEKSTENLDFQASADIFAESVKALIAQKKVTENDVAPRVISSVVAGPIAKGLWNKDNACRDPRIHPEHLAEIQRAFPGSFARSALRAAPGPAATVVAEISF